MENDFQPSSVDAAAVTTVEIRIRTLDSSNYTLRVDKDVPVPALKDQLASVVGVPSEDQRLICRGRVLKDDQLLSYYNVEDGHTLHLVARPPGIPAEETPVTQEPAAAAPRRATISHSVVLGTINIPESVEGGLMPELNRILSAVFAGGAPSVENRRGVALMQVSSSGIPASNAPAAATSTTIPSETRRQVPADSLHFRNVEVVPDALTTIGQYLARMEQSFSDNGYGSVDTSFLSSLGTRQQQSNAGSSPASGAASRPLPSPASLGSTISRVQQLLHGQASSALTYLASQLENEPNVSDSTARADLQSIAVWSGNIMQQLGALLMELGRTTLTLRLGATPAQAVVNSGPAIFVSPTGPNPMMVQPLPFQTGLPLGGILGASSQQPDAAAAGSVSARTVGLSPTPGESTTGRRFVPLFGSIALHHAGGGGDAASPATAATAEEGNANSTVAAAVAAAAGSDGPRQAQSEQEGSESLGLVVQENGTVRLLPVRTRSASLFRGLRSGSEAVSVPVLGIRAQVHAHPWTQAVLQASEGQRPVGIAVTIPVDVTTSRVNGQGGAPADADAGNDSTTSREAQVVVDGREASTQNCSEQTPAAAEGGRMATQASEDGDERSSRKRAEQEDGAESCMSTSPPDSEHPQGGNAKRQKMNK